MQRAKTAFTTCTNATVGLTSQSVTGTYLDPTGLYNMGARSYNAHLARFTTTDPSGQETNPYLYAAGDPINYNDPTGLFRWDVALGAGLVGALALAAGTALGGPILGGAMSGCAGTAVGEAISGAPGGDVAKGCVVGGCPYVCGQAVWLTMRAWMTRVGTRYRCGGWVGRLAWRAM
ncbi:RHS repeat-associated core domain-containing protein [Streptomyces sp. MBT27]|uniref:RHS repeat-associated core domain-containing protein n=1 Tax=Streptomyces sp. MBT27 TaxID=1488356 RepID=UPI0031FE6AFE